MSHNIARRKRVIHAKIDFEHLFDQNPLARSICSIREHFLVEVFG